MSRKIAVVCESVKEELMGHNKDVRFVYAFRAEMVFGVLHNYVIGGLQLAYDQVQPFKLGEVYVLELKS